MSSPEIEAQLENASLDLALGYLERLTSKAGRLRSWPQARERYYFLGRHRGKPGKSLRYGSPMAWSEAAAHPLCQLTPEMHNRAIIDGTLASVGISSAAAMETNSLLAVTLAVAVGDLSAILPGDLVAAVRGNCELEARPLVKPDIRVPLGFMALADDRPSRALQAALRLMAAPDWAAALEKYAGEGGF